MFSCDCDHKAWFNYNKPQNRPVVNTSHLMKQWLAKKKTFIVWGSGISNIENKYWLSSNWRSNGMLNTLLTIRGQYNSGSFLWIQTSLKSLTLSFDERANWVHVGDKIAAFMMRTWFKGPLLPSKASFKIRKNKVGFVPMYKDDFKFPAKELKV